MSKITTIYNAVTAEVAGLFGSKTRIPNAYDIENNPVNFLRNGWGLRIDASSPNALRTVNDVSQARTFTIILTSEVHRLDTDITAIDTTSKSLLEDAKTLIEGMEASDEMGASDEIDNCVFSGSSEISLLGGSRSHFLALEVNFDISYRENIT